MPIVWRYTPPSIDALPVVHAAVEAGVELAAEHLLEAAKKVVPVESGRLQASGRVTPDGLAAVVSFGREDDADLLGFDEHDRAIGSSPSAAYAVKQHEDLTLHHPNGGSGKYLETPMHEEAAAIAAILVASVRKAIDRP